MAVYVVPSRPRMLAHCVWIALLFVALRSAFNAILLPPFRRLVKRRKLGTGADKLVEEVYLIFFGLLLVVSSIVITFHAESSRGCNLYTTRSCFSSFAERSQSSVGAETVWYYLFELGWYLHLLLKGAFGVGRHDGLAMEIHHVVTIALVASSFCFGFTKVGMLVFSVFNISTPLLHVSKLCNYLELGRARVLAFLLFAAAFTATRIVLLPLKPIRATLYAKSEICQAAGEAFYANELRWTHVFVSAKLSSLWFLNVYWLEGIARVIRKNVGTRTTRGVVADDIVGGEEPTGPARPKAA